LPSVVPNTAAAIAVAASATKVGQRFFGGAAGGDVVTIRACSTMRGGSTGRVTA
jgi:hypothetical protein